MGTTPLLIKARTKAGRARIARILDYAQHVTKTEIDNITDERSVEPARSIDLLRQFIEIDGKSAELYEIADCEFVYFTGSSAQYVTRYNIHTIAMPC